MTTGGKAIHDGVYLRHRTVALAQGGDHLRCALGDSESLPVGELQGGFGAFDHRVERRELRHADVGKLIADCEDGLVDGVVVFGA